MTTADRVALARYAAAWAIDPDPGDPPVHWEDMPELSEHDSEVVSSLVMQLLGELAEQLRRQAGERGADLWERTQ